MVTILADAHGSCLGDVMSGVKQMNQQPKLITLGAMRLDEIFGYLVFVAMLLSLALPPFRYLNYLLPMVMVFLLLANRDVFVPDLARPYVVLILASLLSSPFANGEGVKDIYLILTGLSVALVGYRQLWHWRTIMLAAILGLVVYFVLVGAVRGWSTVFSHLTLNVASSASTFESGFSYVFGLLTVWAAYTRRWRSFALAFLFAILTLKRIVILGILICLVVQFLPRNWLLKLLKPLPMILANALFLFLILSYGSGSFDALIHEWTSQSANQFGMGRQVLYSYIVADFFREPLRFIFMGMGPGEAYDVIKGGLSWVRKENLHGDTLKILYEYGGIVLSLFIWALYSSKNSGVLLIALYTNVLLLTDNTLIYPFYIYFATLIAACIAAADHASAPKPVPAAL